MLPFILTAATVCLVFTPCQGNLVEPPFTAVEQTLPPECERLLYCPSYALDLPWEAHEKQCCGSNRTPGVAFHCQDQCEDSPPRCQVVVACVHPEMTKPGEYLWLHKITPDNAVSQIAWLEHRPCPDDLYEPDARKSVSFMLATCSHSKQECKTKYGKTLARAGGPTEDNRCRCLWEKGWAPVRASPKCTDSTGFDSHSSCRCQQSTCLQGHRLNEEFKCIAESTPVPYMIPTCD